MSVISFSTWILRWQCVPALLCYLYSHLYTCVMCCIVTILIVINVWLSNVLYVAWGCWLVPYLQDTMEYNKEMRWDGPYKCRRHFVDRSCLNAMRNSRLCTFREVRCTMGIFVIDTLLQQLFYSARVEDYRLCRCYITRRLAQWGQHAFNKSPLSVASSKAWSCPIWCS